MAQIDILESPDSERIARIIDASEKASKLQKRAVWDTTYLKSHLARCMVWYRAELQFLEVAGFDSRLFDFSKFCGPPRFAAQNYVDAARGLEDNRHFMIKQFRPDLAMWRDAS
jgi:hypothetical protein